MPKPKKVKCPFFMNRTNGKKLYINCSTEDHINSSSIQEAFNTIEARKVCYQINCCNDYSHCKNYVQLRKVINNGN